MFRYTLLDRRSTSGSSFLSHQRTKFTEVSRQIAADAKARAQADF